MNVYQAASALKLNFYIYRGYALAGGCTYFTLVTLKDQISHYYKYTRPQVLKRRELLAQGYTRYIRY